MPAELYHAYYKYYVYVRPEKLKPGWNRDRIMVAINEAGIPCTTGSCGEIYLEKAFTRRGWQPKERLPVAQELSETSLMFLVHPTLGLEHMRATADVVERVMEEATA
ncbi:MAG: hypothetical protein KatS3mg073_1451 [Meiothermus sp.]|nr:MAG: hypothetical protein KatS3mg073_1451 [Meiothermus sp.]